MNFPDILTLSSRGKLDILRWRRNHKGLSGNSLILFHQQTLKVYTTLTSLLLSEHLANNISLPSAEWGSSSWVPQTLGAQAKLSQDLWKSPSLMLKWQGLSLGMCVGAGPEARGWRGVVIVSYKHSTTFFVRIVIIVFCNYSTNYLLSLV